MLVPLLFFLVFMPPAFAALEQRAANRRAQKLVEQVRADMAAGRTTPDPPPERKLAFWPYALIALILAGLWTLANAHVGDTQSSLIGVGVTAAVIVWLVFHIFVFVKRTNTGVSVLTLAAMIAVAAGLGYATQISPALAALAERLN